MDVFFSTLSGRLDLLTWTGLGLFLVLAVTLGWFVPRRTHDRMIAIQAEASERALKIQAESYQIVIDGLTQRNTEVVADKVEHREGSKAWEAAATELLAQNKTMLEQNTTTVHALEGLRESLVELAGKDVTQ
jgi:hypothetical protein